MCIRDSLSTLELSTWYETTASTTPCHLNCYGPQQLCRQKKRLPPPPQHQMGLALHGQYQIRMDGRRPRLSWAPSSARAQEIGPSQKKKCTAKDLFPCVTQRKTMGNPSNPTQNFLGNPMGNPTSRITLNK